MNRKKPIRKSRRRIVKRPSKPQRKYSKKKIYSPIRESFLQAHHTTSKLTRRTYKRREFSRFRADYEGQISSEIQRFVGTQLRKKRGNQYIFQIKATLKVKKKKITHYFSPPRVQLKSLAQAKKYGRDYLEKIFQVFEKYLSRSDFRSLTISGMRSEVVKEVQKTVRRKRPHASKRRRIHKK